MTALPAYTDNFGLDNLDQQRLLDIAKLVRRTSTDNLLANMLPDPQAVAVRNWVAAHCSFSHAGLVVFPKNIDGVLGLLRALGFQPNDVLPSVVVRQRLARRYGLDPDRLDVRMTHGAITGWDSAERQIEVFMVLETGALSAGMVSAERRYEFEQHLALAVPDSELAVLERLRVALRDFGGFVWDGGGYNAYEDATGGGRTVLYFAKPLGVGAKARLRRLEVKARGDFSALAEQNYTHNETIAALYQRAIG